MNNRVLDEFNSYYGEKNRNLRCSALLIALNKIIYENHFNQQSFCAETFLSKHVYDNITCYRSENYQFKTLAAFFIAANVPLNEAENLFREAGYYLNHSMMHSVIRFALEKHLTLYEADELLFEKTGKHFFTFQKNNS